MIPDDYEPIEVPETADEPVRVTITYEKLDGSHTFGGMVELAARDDGVPVALGEAATLTPALLHAHVEPETYRVARVRVTRWEHNGSEELTLWETDTPLE